MRTSLMLTAIACLLGFTSLSHADQTIASPAIFGSLAQDRARCLIGNLGTNSVSVDVNIFDESGNIVPASTSCLSPVEPHFICSVTATISAGAAYACSATTSGKAKNLRGTLVLTDRVLDGFGGSKDVPLRSAELR